MKRNDNEPPISISKKGMRYHHIGIPTDELRPNEKYLEELKCYVAGFDTSEYGIEWMRFEENSPVSDVIKKIPHIAFEVKNLDSVIEEKKIISEISSPSKGVRVAMILENGVPIEFLEFDKKAPEDFPELESERSKFRQILLSDSKGFYNIKTDDDVMRYMDSKKLQSLVIIEKLIKSIIKTFKEGTKITWEI